MLIRRLIDEDDEPQPSIDCRTELPFRLRCVERLRAGESEPFADPTFDPYIESRSAEQRAETFARVIAMRDRRERRR